MKFLTPIILFSATVLAAPGQYGGGSDQTATAPAPADVTPPPASMPNSNMGGGNMVFTVTVGGSAGLVYTPEFINAEPGDMVKFVFHKMNHTATQSSFLKPCNRLEGGEDSGFMPNINNTVVPPPSFNYVVKDKAPTWWYCKQRNGNHCGKGMVFAINPTVEKSFDMFRQLAIQINGTTTSTSSMATTAMATASMATTAMATTAMATTAMATTAMATTSMDNTVTMIVQPTDTVQPPPPPPPASMPPSMTAAPPSPYTTPGFNQNENPAACQCACFCGVGTFPQGDGFGSYGGFGGSMKRGW